MRAVLGVGAPRNYLWRRALPSPCRRASMRQLASSPFPLPPHPGIAGDLSQLVGIGGRVKVDLGVKALAGKSSQVVRMGGVLLFGGGMQRAAVITRRGQRCGSRGSASIDSDEMEQLG